MTGGFNLLVAEKAKEKPFLYQTSRESLNRSPLDSLLLSRWRPRLDLDLVRLPLVVPLEAVLVFFVRFGLFVRFGHDWVRADYWQRTDCSIVRNLLDPHCRDREELRV